MQVRLDKLNRLIEAKDNPYKNGLSPKNLSSELHASYNEKSREELESASVAVSVAGRMMAIRDFGKAAFVRLRDRAGIIQLYFQKQAMGDESFAKFRELDIGDIVYAEGTIFKTKTGELSINVTKFELLTKSLRPLPEKYHGIADVEIKYRQRYLDLIMSEETKKTFVARSKIIEEIRRFF